MHTAMFEMRKNRPAGCWELSGVPRNGHSFFSESNLSVGYRGHGQVASEGRKNG